LVAVLSVFVTGQNSSQQNAAKSKTASSRQSPEEIERDISFNLLEEAYGTSRDLSSDIRIPLLSQICQDAGRMNRSSRGVFAVRGQLTLSGSTVKARETRAELTRKQNARAKDWTEELYSLGSEFPAGSHERAIALMSATRAMAAIDADRALEMFSNSKTEGDSIFDARSGIEYQIFDALYRAKGTAALPDLRRKAIEFGDQGSYPYEAVANLLQQVNGHPDVVRQFFSDAVSYYRRGNIPVQKSFGFMGMLGSKQVRDQLEAWQVQDAAQELAAQAKRYVQSQRELQSQGAATAPGASMLVNAIRGSLKQYAPEIGATIPDPPPFVLSAPPSPGMKSTLPKAPVPDESLKTLRDSFEKNRTAVMVMNEDEIHEGQEMRDTLDRAVSQGAEYVLRTVRAYDLKDHRYALESTIGPLIDTVQVGTRVNPAATLEAVRGIQDSEIKTRLLTVVASSVGYMR
jgi:hypothetical protein